MNGPLRRLARQAIGQEMQRVHAPARLPYQPLPELPSETVGAPPVPPLHQAPSAEPMTAAPRPRAQPDAEPVPPPEHRGAEVHQPAPPPAPILSTAPDDGASSPRPAMSARPTPDAEPRVMSPSSLQPPGPQASSDTGPEGQSDTAAPATVEPSSVNEPARAEAATRAPFLSPTQAPPAAPYADIAPGPVTAHRAPSPVASPAAHSRPREPSFEAPPETLLPPLDARADAAHPPAASAPATSSPPRPAEPPEVHVHIGRIDVTAVPQATKSRPAARGQPPMSLEAYLASRRRKRP